MSRRAHMNSTVTYGQVTIVDGGTKVTLIKKDEIDQDSMTMDKNKFVYLIDKLFTDNF